MTKLTKASHIRVGDKEVSVEEMINALIYLPGEQVLGFFQSIGLMVPRKVRMVALRRVLDPYVKAKHVALATLSDEVNYRLGWYQNFSETQLVNLLPMFNDKELIYQFRQVLWFMLLEYLIDKKVGEEDTLRLITAANNHVLVAGKIFEDVIAFNEVINPLFFDEPNTIDGLTPDVFRPVLYKSSTLVELREIGKKFGINVPRRLKKQELAEIIKQVLIDRNELTDEEAEKIDKMAVIALQRYAKDRDIKASIELKKEEIIEYILKNAESTKEKYFIPDSPGVYEMLEPDLEEEVVEEVVEEVIEEVIEEVVEEPVLEEVPEVVDAAPALSSEQFEELLMEIRLLKQEVERLSEEIHELRHAEFTIIEDDYDDEDYDDYDEYDDYEDEDDTIYHVHQHVFVDEEEEECDCGGHHHKHKKAQAPTEAPKPMMLNPYKPKISEKEWAQVQKTQERAIKQKERDRAKSQPIPVVFPDNFDY